MKTHTFFSLVSITYKIKTLIYSNATLLYITYRKLHAYNNYIKKIDQLKDTINVFVWNE